MANIKFGSSAVSALSSCAEPRREGVKRVEGLAQPVSRFIIYHEVAYALAGFRVGNTGPRTVMLSAGYGC
jgi:hypothetical protein